MFKLTKHLQDYNEGSYLFIEVYSQVSARAVKKGINDNELS